MPPRSNIDLSDGKFTITVSDLMKLIGIVAAIGMSYAMASSRLSLIEQGILDGRESFARIDARLDTIEAYLNDREAANSEAFHDYDLRMQSVEERMFGNSKAPTRRTAPSVSIPAHNAAQPYRPPAKEANRTQEQYRNTKP